MANKEQAERQREHARKWRVKNRAKIRADTAAWRKANPAQARAYTKKWARNNPGKIKAYRIAYNRKNYHRKRGYRLKRHGLTPGSYLSILIEQKHRCAACFCDLTNLAPKKIHVDHCHQSGIVRGILCLNCNTALGLMKDSPQKVRMLAEYISKFPPPTPLTSLLFEEVSGVKKDRRNYPDEPLWMDPPWMDLRD